MKKLSSLLLLALTGGLACGATDGVPAHIVQPLPKELDPRLEPPLAPPSGIVRPLTAEETARRERELAPVPTAGLKEDGEKAIEAYNVKEKTVDGQIQEFRQQHQVTGNAAAPAADTAPAAPNPEENFMRANSSNNLYSVDCDGDLYFDMEEGVLVFMKNVRVRNPNLSMDCADHLKIYAEFVPKKPGDKKPSERKQEKEKEKEKEAAKTQEEKTAKVRLNEKRRMSFKEKREFEQLEQEIAALEAEKQSIEEALCSGALSVEELTEKSKRLPELTDLIDEKTMRWLELSEIESN